MPADESEPHVGVIVAQKSVLRLRKPIAARAHRLRATQSPPTNADVRRRMGPRGAGLFCAMHGPASAVLRRNRPTSEAPQGATTPLPGSSRCAQSAEGVVSTLHNTSYRRSSRTSRSRCENSSHPAYGRLSRRQLGARRTGGLVELGTPASSTQASMDNSRLVRDSRV